MLKKIVENLLITIDFLFLICVAGFVDERPLISLVFLILFGVLSRWLSKNWLFDDYFKEEK